MIGAFLLVIMGLFAASFAAGVVLAVRVSNSNWNAWLIGAIVWGLCLFAWVPAFAVAGHFFAKGFGFVPTPSVGDYFRPDLGVAVTIVPSLCVGYMLSRGTERMSILWVCGLVGVIAAVLVTKAYVISGGVVWEVVVLGWLGLWAVEARGANRRKRGECPQCRYDVTGLPPGAKCPECGHESAGQP